MPFGEQTYTFMLGIFLTGELAGSQGTRRFSFSRYIRKFSKEKRLAEWLKGFLLQQMGIQVKREF